jgi:hypothetical protein
VKPTLTATLLIAGVLSFCSENAIAAKNGIFVYGCTSDGKPARMRVVAPLKYKGAVEAGFRNMIRQKRQIGFLRRRRPLI